MTKIIIWFDAHQYDNIHRKILLDLLKTQTSFISN